MIVVKMVAKNKLARIIHSRFVLIRNIAIRLLINKIHPLAGELFHGFHFFWHLFLKDAEMPKKPI
jgi:hypothetical protein